MSLTEKLTTATVSELNLRPPLTIGPDQTVSAAIEAMRQANLGCVIVADPQNKPVGMLTEGMVRDRLAMDASFIDDTVETQMATLFPRVMLDDTVELVLAALHTNNTRFLCVVDDEGCIHGLTGQKGLMEFIAEHFPRQVMVQHIGCTCFSDRQEGA